MTNFEETIKQIDIRMQALADDRDHLDALIDKMITELESLKGNCSEAYESLQRARNTLSELV